MRAVEPVDHGHAHILHMHMADARVVVVDGAQHVAAGKGQMPGIEQQRNAFAGMAHEGIEFRLGLDHRRHVVVIGERHALLGAPFAELGQTPCA